MSGLGERLKNEREMRGVSLDEIARATRIHQKFLQALEENDFDALPAPVFVTGFLRSYASHLGMDADSLVAEYDAVKVTPKERQPLISEEHRAPIISQDDINRNFPLIAAVGGILLVVALLAVFVTRSSAPRETAPVQKPEEEDLLARTAEAPPPEPAMAPEQPPAEEPVKTHEPVAAKVIEPVPAPAPSKPIEKPKQEPAKPAEPQPSEPAIAAKPADKPKVEAAQEVSQKGTYKYNLALSAVEQDVWVYVLIDDTDVRDMYVRAGQTVLLRGSQSFVLTTGNAHYLKLKVNGTAAEIPGSATNKIIRNWFVPLPG